VRFYEHESREILGQAGIRVADGDLAHTPQEVAAVARRLGGPVVIKSQVLAGGRMKAGGVGFAATPAQAARRAAEILGRPIGGRPPRGVLVARRLAVVHEHYAAVAWDGVAKRPVLLFGDEGGIDVEETARENPGRVGRVHLPALGPASAFHAREALAAAGVTGPRLAPLAAILVALADLFARRDLTLAEINPLAELEDGSLVALDAHMEIEEEARPRQRDWLRGLGVGDEETRLARDPTAFEQAGAAVDASDHRGVAGSVTEFDGDLGLVIGAGGGSLTLFDAVRAHGGRPANFCEIGGNPSVAKTCALAKLVLGKPGVERIAVMMSIVSNTRVDIVARGVVKACLDLGMDPAEKIAVFRIPGAWEDEGAKILERYGIAAADRSVSMHEAARRAVVAA
jgi:succinyl-CoA synthetase beta subunit/citryl-CoA synthetase large subunit